MHERSQTAASEGAGAGPEPRGLQASASRAGGVAAEDIPRLWEVVNESDNAIVVAGPDTRVIHINAGFSRMFEYTREEMLGRKISEVLLGPQTDMAAVQAMLQGLTRPGAKQADLLFYRKSGRPLWVSVVANPVFGADGRFESVVGIFADITHTKMHAVLQHRVLDAMAHERPMLEVMNLVCSEVERIAPEVIATILSVDADGRLHTLAAPSMPESFFSYCENLPIGPQAGSCGTAAWRGEPVEVTSIERDPLWEQHRAAAQAVGVRACWSSPIQANDGRVLGTFAFYFREERSPDALHRRLVSASVHLCALALEREEAKERIHRLAFFDTLTGLPNRAMLRAQAERALVMAARSSEPLAVLFIDLDRFKFVNDSQGHAAGDQLLHEVARRLTQAVRGDDLVGRLSGDEFVAVLPACGADHAGSTAQRILAAIARPFVAGEASLQPGASIGVAMYPQDGQDMAALLRHADMAMYQAKSEGRGQLRFFSDEMNRAARERVELEAALREALHEGGLELHYQPQFETRGERRVHCVEALVRWRHPRLGLVSPARFVPLAEECGLIGLLTRWVLAEACRQMAAWRRSGLPVPRVAVNVSANDFLDDGFAPHLAALLRAHRLAPHELTLEMTETTMVDSSPAVLANIDAVHALGIQLSMDDFGTGYSSLSYLHRLPIDELKLDKSFVQDLAGNPTVQVLINTVLRIGESLHLSVVAEGVETEEQHAFLAERGCPVVQGYLFARPMPAAALERWFEEQGAGVAPG